MIRAVVTGSECTGKTTLAEGLGEAFDAPVVPEYARRFVSEHGRAPEATDVEAIARGQMALEDELAAGTRELLIQDTDLLSTVIYSRHYYGDCPRWIEEALRHRAADLYLLAGIDVPWIADGDQRDRGDRRKEMQELFRHALVVRSFPFVEAVGSVESRLRCARLEIERLLAG
jgi:NadR type nicotinamide-nucleotide adenylyltransferase